MTELNGILWTLSVLLQAALLATLFYRGTARRLSAFTVLLAFYLGRSILLYAAFHHIADTAYTKVFDTLSLLDLLLQMLVAWQLFQPAADRLPMSHSPRALRASGFTGLLALALTFAWGLSRIVHAHPRRPVDRGVLFAGALVLLVCATTRRSRLSILARPVLNGLAVLAATGIASQVGRSIAALHRNASAFRAWSYIESVVYLILLAYWLLSQRAQVLPPLDAALPRPLQVSGKWPVPGSRSPV